VETFAPDGLAVFVTAEVLQCGRIFKISPRMVLLDDPTEVMQFLYQLSLKQYMTQKSVARLFFKLSVF